MSKKFKHFHIFSILGAIITPTLAYIVGNKFYKLAMDPHADKAAILNAPHNRTTREVVAKEIEEKYENLEKKDIFLVSFNNSKLKAKKIYNNKKTDNWILLCHGFGGTNVVIQNAALKFLKLGFNLLIPDLRGFGETQGDYIGWGWHDRIDICDWCKKIVEENENAKIVLWGMSMGASAVMAACGEDISKNVKAAIEDSGYSSLWSQFFYQYKLFYKTPAAPVLALASSFAKIKLGFSFKEVDLVKQVKNSKIPMLFIHGEKDTFVPTTMVQKVYDACYSPKQKLIIKNSKHMEGMFENKELYWTTIKYFLKSFL